MSPSQGCRVITVANQKGGVGKTTTTMNLGVALARQGKRVLLIDSDPQANLTSYLGVTPGAAPYESSRTLDEIYLSKRAFDSAALAQFLTPTPSGVDLIATEQGLSGVEYFLFPRADKETVLAQFLAGIRSRYDYVLIDTPPSLSLLTLNALCASDHVLIPVQAEFFSLEGIVKIREAIENVRSRWNPKLTVLGVLPTQISPRRKLTQDVLEALRSELGETLFTSMIHDSAAVTESSGHARSVIEYDRASKGAKDYLAAADEVLRRTTEVTA